MTTREKPTMQMIAAEAGVSVSTVSRVLAGTSKASDRTAEHIRTLAQELGYRRNARPAGVQQRVGLLHLYQNRYPPQVAMHVALHQTYLHGFWESARRHHCLLSIDYAPTDAKPESSLLFNTDQVAGIIVKGAVTQDWIDALPANAPPLVFFRSPVGLDYPGSVIDSNNLAGMTQAIHHLHALGHRHIAFFCLHNDRLSNYDRISSYQHTLIRLGLDAETYLATPPADAESVTTESVIEATLDRWLKLDQPPTAIVCQESYCVIFEKLLLDRGMKLPDDMSLVDIVPGLSMANRLDESSRFTRLEVPVSLMTEAAVEHLLRQVESDHASHQRVQLTLKLLLGESTGPPRS